MAKLRDRLRRWLDIPLRIPAGVASGHVVEARVEAGALAFRCEQATLELSPEALATAFLLPAAAQGRRLAGSVIDPRWLQGAQQALGLAEQWWGWHAGAPRFAAAAAQVPVPGVGLAFSLGVDSFHSLFFADPAPDLLVLAAGFDVPLEQSEVLAAMRDSVAQVAAATGKAWAYVETDIRRHPLFRRVSWEKSHGSAVAVLGHLLRRHVGTMLVSSTQHQDSLSPWGSRPDIDPLWSSSCLTVRHVGHDVHRSEKLARLLRHPQARELVRRHLRVCWKQPSAAGNCGRCEKCVRLRLNLEKEAPGFTLETMPGDVPLAEAIDALPPQDQVRIRYLAELADGQQPNVQHALEDLFQRSGVS